MHVDHLKFGSIQIDGQVFSEDIVIDRGNITNREKFASRKYKSSYGHTPLSAAENIPWNCKQLVIGTGMYGSLPVMEEVKQAAKEKGVRLLIKETPEAVKYLNEADTNFVLHLTC